jgi:hypothetical protein
MVATSGESSSDTSVSALSKQTGVAPHITTREALVLVDRGYLALLAVKVDSDVNIAGEFSLDP